MSDQPLHELTNEERAKALLRYREWECRTEGHAFEVICVSQSDDPYEVICTRCGRLWKVEGGTE